MSKTAAKYAFLAILLPLWRYISGTRYFPDQRAGVLKTIQTRPNHKIKWNKTFSKFYFAVLSYRYLPNIPYSLECKTHFFFIFHGQKSGVRLTFERVLHSRERAKIKFKKKMKRHPYVRGLRISPTSNIEIWYSRSAKFGGPFHTGAFYLPNFLKIT